MTIKPFIFIYIPLTLLRKPLQRYSVTGCNACNACNGVTLVTPTHPQNSPEGLLNLHSQNQNPTWNFEF